MPQNVQMPDGTIVAMPDNPTPEELNALAAIAKQDSQAAQPAPTPEANPLKESFANAAAAVEKPVQAFNDAVGGVASSVMDKAKGAVDATGLPALVDIARGAPTEIAAQGGGTLAGARFGASIPGPPAVKAIGALVGGFAGGGYGGALGAEVDNILGKLSLDAVGKGSDESFGDHLQSAFENQIWGSLFGFGAKGIEAGLGRISKTEAFDSFIKTAIAQSKYLPTSIQQKITPLLARSKNASEIVSGTFNNPITGAEYEINAREAGKRLSGGTSELPVPYETGGKLMGNKAKSIADQGDNNVLADYMDNYAAKVRLQADKVISGGYTPTATAGLIKDSIKAYDKMLSEPLNLAEKALLKHANTQIGDNVIKKNLTKILDPELNAAAQTIDPNTLNKFEKAIKALPQNATVTDLRQFNAKLSSITGDLNPRDIGVADKISGEIRGSLESQLTGKLSQLSNVGQYKKAADAITALKDYNTAAKGKAAALDANKFFTQIGVKDAAQADIKLTDDAVINKLFENYENYAGFKKMTKLLPQGDKTLMAAEDAFRYKIRTALTEDVDGVLGGAEKLLRKGGGLSAVPQDRLISEAAGPEVLKYLQDLSVVNKALGKRSVSGSQGINPAVRGPVGGLGLSTAFSSADAQRLLTKLDDKLALGVSNKFLKAMTDPKLKDTFYRVATTPLVSPQSYNTYVAAMSALGAAVSIGKEEFDHNAQAVQKLIEQGNKDGN